MKELDMRELLDKLNKNEDLTEGKRFPNHILMIREMMSDLVEAHMECESEHGPDDEITLFLADLVRKYSHAQVGSRTR